MIEYPPEPLPGESRAEWDRRIAPWRMEMKRKLLTRRGWRCERDGCQNPAEHLDECCLTRQEMRGLSLEQRRIAFSEQNMELVCASCNVESAQDRDGAWHRQCARYGENAMKQWYSSLRLRAPRHDWLPKES